MKGGSGTFGVGRERKQPQLVLWKYAWQGNVWKTCGKKGNSVKVNVSVLIMLLHSSSETIPVLSYCKHE